MKLNGSYQINLEKQKVWEALNDPEILKQSIPGCEEFKKNSNTEFTATATNKIGPFNASFTGDIELKNINAPNSYVIEGSGNSPVGFASGLAQVKLEDSEGGTKLTYEVEANVAVTGAKSCVYNEKSIASALSKNFSSSSLDSVKISSSGMNSDIHASADYRANMVKVFAKKAVDAC